MTSFTFKYHLHFSRVKRLKLQRNQVYYQKQMLLTIDLHMQNFTVKLGEQYFLCYAAFNATAVALSVVGSVPKSDPTADSATAVALNAA